MNRNISQSYDAVIVGGGIVGLVSALLLDRMGLKMSCLYMPSSLPPDGSKHISRSVALMHPTWELLRDQLDLAALPTTATSLHSVTVIDGDREVCFDASDIMHNASSNKDKRSYAAEQACFGWAISNSDFLQFLYDHCVARGIDLHGVDVSDICFSATDCTISGRGEYGDFTCRTPFVIAADGAHSLCRSAAGIGIVSYESLLGRRPDQWILTAQIAHSKAHDGMSFEHHREGGVLTSVPATGRHSNIIWMDHYDEIAYLRDLDKAAFLRELHMHFGAYLGCFEDVHDRHIFPLRTQMAQRYCKGRVFLVGESAHVLPPIGAQGLNLGLRDAFSASDVIGAAYDASFALSPTQSDHRHLTEEFLTPYLRDYSASRRLDHLPRHMMVEFLNLSLLSESSLLTSMRRNALGTVEHFPFFKRGLMQLAMRSMHKTKM